MLENLQQSKRLFVCKYSSLYLFCCLDVSGHLQQWIPAVDKSKDPNVAVVVSLTPQKDQLPVVIKKLIYSKSNTVKFLY